MIFSGGRGEDRERTENYYAGNPISMVTLYCGDLLGGHSGSGRTLRSVAVKQ